MRSYTNRTSIMVPAELTGYIEETFTEGKIAELSNGKSILFKDIVNIQSGTTDVEDFNGDVIQIYNNHIVSIKAVKVGIAKNKDYSFIVAFKFLEGEVKFDYSFTYNKGRMFRISGKEAPSFRDYQENIEEYNQNVECVFLLSNSKFKN